MSARRSICAAASASYFNSAAAEDIRTANLVPEIRAVDFIETESEVDALLLEARLIKDVQPRFNQELKDDKTFPYLEIRIREEFPRVEFTRKPRPRGTKLYGPFTNAKKLRAAIAVLQKIFRFRTCSLDIAEGDERWRWFRPCLLYNINQCTAPCNFRISREEYRRNIRRLILFLDGKKEAPAAGNEGRNGTGLQGAEIREGGPHPRRNPGARQPEPAGQARRRRAARSLLHRPEERNGGAQEDLRPRRSFRGGSKGSTSPTCRAARPWPV